MVRTCCYRREDGTPCRATPMREHDSCFWHSEEHAEEAAEARRLGGQRRKRERIVSQAYDFDGLATVASVRRLLEVAVIDTLGLDNGVARNRTLASLAISAGKLLEAAELESRVVALERLLEKRKKEPFR